MSDKKYVYHYCYELVDANNGAIILHMGDGIAILGFKISTVEEYQKLRLHFLKEMGQTETGGKKLRIKSLTLI